jgi:hypothetical protein
MATGASLVLWIQRRRETVEEGVAIEPKPAPS